MIVARNIWILYLGTQNGSKGHPKFQACAEPGRAGVVAKAIEIGRQLVRGETRGPREDAEHSILSALSSVKVGE